MEQSLNLEHSLKWHSPRSTSGSFLSAVLVHGALYGLLVLVLGVNFFKHEEPLNTEAEVSYEMVNDVPKPQPEIAKPDVARELQDEKSEVAGTQEKPKQEDSAQGVSKATNNDAPPYYKVKPKYPKAALLAGTEGWILMNVDVKEDGTVENVRVLDGDKRNMFQEEARRAVEKWKYKPFVDNSGHPFMKKDHQVRVDFKINEATM